MLSLSHTLYQLLHILSSSLPFSLSPQLSLLLLQWCYSILSGCSLARGLWRSAVQPVRYRVVYRRAVRTARTLPAALALPGADSLRTYVINVLGCNIKHLDFALELYVSNAINVC